MPNEPALEELMRADRLLDIDPYATDKEADRIAFQRSQRVLERVRKSRSALEAKAAEFDRFIERLLLHENGVLTPGDPEYDQELVLWITP